METTDAVFEEQLKRLPRTALLREYLAKRQAPPPKQESFVPDFQTVKDLYE